MKARCGGQAGVEQGRAAWRDVKEGAAAHIRRDQIRKGLGGQGNMFRLRLEGSGEPWQDSEQGKHLVRNRLQGARSGSQKVGAEARARAGTHRDGLGVLSIQAQEDVAHRPNGLPGPQRLRRGGGAVHVHGGHAFGHAQ